MDNIFSVKVANVSSFKVHNVEKIPIKFLNFIFLRLQDGLQDKGYEEWTGEMIGMREILRVFANVSRSDIVGMRAPFLLPGRNTQFEVRFIHQSSNCFTWITLALEV